MADQNWWDQYEQVDTAQPAPSAGIIRGRPKQSDAIAMRGLELRENSDARAAAAADRAAGAAERSAGAQETQVNNTRLDNTSGLRKEFNALPEVKDFTAMRSARNRIGAIATKPDATAQDDIALVFSYMKMLDPGSVVREGEYAQAQSATGVPAQILNTYNKLLTGERLNPEQRQNMARSAIGVYKSQRDIFNERAKYYRDIAGKQGLDPDAITGFYADKPEDQLEAQPKTATLPLGEIQFGADPGGVAPGAKEYAREAEDGIRNGTIKNADDLTAVAKKYGFGEPDRAGTEKFFEQLRQGARFGGVPVPDYSSVQQARQRMQAERGDSIADPFLRGVADTVTLGLADEIAGVSNAIATGGNVSEQIALQRATDQFDEQNNFAPRIVGQVVGGFGLPTGGASSVGQLARLGAGYGAAYGFGSTDGSVGQRLGGAAIGGATGGISAAALGGLGNTITSRLASRPPTGGGGNAPGREVYQAAVDAGITDDAGRALVLPSDVGGPMTRRMTAGANQTVFGSGPVTRAAERAQTRAGQRLSEIASADGQPVRQEVLGEVGQNAAQGYIDRTGAVSQRQYGRARELAGDTRLRGTRAVANIDGQLQELAPTSNTDAGLISGLERLRADLANEGQLADLSIDSMRRLRTSTRAEARSEGLRSTDYNRRAGMVLDELSADIADQLSPRAAAEFRRADRNHAQRLDTIDNVMQDIVGKGGDRSAEAVANRLINLGRTDSAKLRSFLNSVDPEEAGIVRGSLVQEMGRANSGAQNAGGNGFSLQTFLTNWDKMPERTKETLFRGEHRQAIEGLARYAEGARGTRAYANTSNTAGAVSAGRIASSAASGTAAVGTLGVSAVLENLTGRLLGSRRFAQWLARAPSTPAQQANWARRLSTIATREPAITQDILPLQEALQSTISRAAASDQEQKRR